MHVDISLRIAPAPPRLPGAVRSDGSAERLVPEHDLFAGLLPQALGEIAKHLVSSIGPLTPGNSENDRFGAHIGGEAGQFLDHITLVANDGVGRGQDPGIADGDFNAPRTVADGHDGHAAIVRADVAPAPQPAKKWAA